MAGSWGEVAEGIITAAWRALTKPGVTKTAKEVVKEVITKTPRVTPQTLAVRMRKLELEALKVFDDFGGVAGKVYQPGGGGWTESIARQQAARMKEFRRIIGEINRPDIPTRIWKEFDIDRDLRWFKFRQDPTHQYRNFERGFD